MRAANAAAGMVAKRVAMGTVMDCPVPCRVRVRLLLSPMPGGCCVGGLCRLFGWM